LTEGKAVARERDAREIAGGRRREEQGDREREKIFS
jgi:hypothetical protein